jgi:hypothetical protein
MPRTKQSSESGQKREGKLSIPLPFDDAVKAALKAKPPEKPKRKPRAKKAKK